MKRTIQFEDTQTVLGRVQGQGRAGGDPTISELATKHRLHPNQITQWKRRAIENLAKAFDDKAADTQVGREAEVAKLHAKIGPLVVERDVFGQGL
ncbi:transposase IS3/IS911 family protein [Nitratireductor pacificus pht-3B]|uniref:Transposase IS3/IS911 family protein n=1 Tax=Nitratireductor pacificus pht-3B TaxID=391937 RepID=K2M6F6_9HYPH|nr:transposase IS3/IS911 family protein [Nitratireductor pacificus pht-3B]